ncbi:hypothetical protein BC938DRAFT_483317 [Jimgerdemannia flammicorona]|uniref:Uncharacterized protein n=1 Tax=Jimgerdemannia flammicorona TaxID=994334 RepID=A0A433QC96_9FUNG|nr:hypothetical protein BC938DRAFT_483317 [Jimgerdemannia flammicorona]
MHVRIHDDAGLRGIGTGAEERPDVDVVFVVDTASREQEGYDRKPGLHRDEVITLSRGLKRCGSTLCDTIILFPLQLEGSN